MELQVNEVVDLLVVVIVAPLLVLMLSRPPLLGSRNWLMGGYACIIAAETFTIIEGVGGRPGEWLNLLEHLALLLAGLAFCIVALRARRSMTPRVTS